MDVICSIFTWDDDDQQVYFLSTINDTYHLALATLCFSYSPDPLISHIISVPIYSSPTFHFRKTPFPAVQPLCDINTQKTVSGQKNDDSVPGSLLSVSVM